MTTTTPTRQRRRVDQQQRRTAVWMVSPALVVMFLVAAVPIGYAVWLSLNVYSVRQADLSQFVGLTNYWHALTSPEWWAAFRQTFLFAIVSVFLEIVLGVAMALLLNLAFRGRGLLRSTLLVPYAVLTVVSAITWQAMFETNLGLVTGVLRALGLPGGEHVWLAEPGYAMTVIIVADVWKTAPFVALLVLAGLQVIPPDVYEAADLDGASRWQTFWRVTLPLLRPAIALAAIFRLLDALRIFDLPFVLTKGASGTETMSMLAYQELREGRLIGPGSALSILTFATVMVVSLVYIRFAGGNIRDVAKER
ncbi:multiple sugar transport system permease protein/trehalose/maltose transport system permease protein [Saccharopolyspora antimicrobica]|uniref:Multiple sugar transport system permease protein/trehalose/maltose transport system permease protein n=1 Tax=Saccharopolyspora antimicrobica TaxID=455193 RepID=A0A1I5GKA6_9PSEU|nr:sugar ABC transporter permease [Saccharopolyspora antimicrobica]RKT87499.1 multiple sugar transport system permease protein/trehalose/maltose transport system permease protein [Saccharopolyspora antimicrobica]SFO36415.1 multiple sugar transport system permease protein/trehalose/maltose transport system permease protein [Saccharopolyspora antimicrobica]